MTPEPLRLFYSDLKNTVQYLANKHGLSLGTMPAECDSAAFYANISVYLENPNTVYALLYVKFASLKHLPADLVGKTVTYFDGRTLYFEGIDPSYNKHLFRFKDESDNLCFLDSYSFNQLINDNLVV